MQITKNFFSKTVLSIALVSISNLTFADNSTSQQESNITNGGDNIILTASKRSAPSNDDHLKEHGGQIYQLSLIHI